MFDVFYLGVHLDSGKSKSELNQPELIGLVGFLKKRFDFRVEITKPNRFGSVSVYPNRKLF